MLEDTEGKSLGELSRDFMLAVAAARHLHEEQYDEVSGIICATANKILGAYLVQLPKGVPVVTDVLGLAPLGLDELRPEVRKRLVDHFGEADAKTWLLMPNVEFGGRLPGAAFRSPDVQGSFLDATCEWPIMNTGRFPKVVTG